MLVLSLTLTQPNNRRPMHALFFYHLTATVIHALSFTLLLQLQTDDEETYQISIPYVEHSGSDGITTRFLHENVFGEFTLLALLLVNEAVTAVSHLAGMIGFAFYRRQMVEDDRHAEVIRRYIEYAITAGLLEAALYVLIGGRDANLLLAIVVTNAIVQLLGYMLERTANVQRQVYLNLAGFSLLIIPIVAFLSAAILTDGFLSISIYYTVLYALFGVHSLLHVLSKAWRDFVDKDAGYIVLGVAAKECLTWMAVAVQAKRYLDHGVNVKSVEEYVDVDMFLQWFPIGVAGFILCALFFSSTITIMDAYDKI